MNSCCSDNYASIALSQSITTANVQCFEQLGAYPPYLIKEQKLDGRWDLDASFIQHLTGKSPSSFSSPTGPKVLHSAIVIVTLETRFALLSTLWFGVAQKARKHLLTLLSNDRQQLDSLLDKIRPPL